MNAQTHSDHSIITAKTIVPEVPADLPALQILRRPTVGPTARICAVGDIGLSGRAALTARRLGPDILFAEIAPVLHTRDIVFGNLESPLAAEIAPGKMFAAPTQGAAILRKAGFNILHLANNHVGEYGQAGLAATLAAVHEADILSLGAGDDLAAAQQMIRTDIDDLHIGWLGCGRTLLPQEENGPQYWEFNEDELVAAVSRARSSVDVLIVSIHIGLMYIDYPRPQHKVMAERLMRTGADLILMHHAHVLQGVQVTSQERVCCYNLGNFLYDWEEGKVKTPVMLREQNEGAVFCFDLDQHGVSAADALPTWIDDDCTVRWATGERGLLILNRLSRISLDLQRNFEALFESQRAGRNTEQILNVLAFHARHGNWRVVSQSLRRARWEHFKMLFRWMVPSRKST